MAVDPIARGMAARTRISGAVTYTVGSGGNFADMAAAVTFLNGIVLTPSASVTLSLLDGTVTHTSAILWQQSWGRSVFIVGANTYAKTLSSVQSSSGSAGAWSVVLNVNSVANIAVNDYAVFLGLSGGTNPTYLAGAWKVTNVDGVNTRITISSTHKNATAPSGAVVGTITILKAVLKFTGCDGFDNWNGGGSTLNIDKCAIVGDGSGSFTGIANDDCGRVYSGTVLAVCGFGGSGVQAIQNSQTNSDGIVAASSNGQRGFNASLGGSINVATLLSSGNGGDGVSAQLGGVVYTGGGAASVATGNTSSGWHATTGGLLYADTTVATGNGVWGYLSDAQGYVSAASVTTANNTTGATQVGFQAVSAILNGSSSTTGSWTVGASNSVAWNGRAKMQSPADGAIIMLPASGTLLTVATLPSASTCGAGARCFVSDANATTFAAVVASGGANNVPVYSDGTNWRIG